MADQKADTAKHLPSQLGLEPLVRLANAGNADALAKLRQVLDDNPQIWQAVGDLADHAELTLIRVIAGSNMLTFESLRRKTAELRQEIGGEQPTPLAKLAASRVIVTWLEVQHLDMLHPADAGSNLPMAKYLVMLKTAAQRRFDGALKSLLLVREKMPAIGLAEESVRSLKEPPRATVKFSA